MKELCRLRRALPGSGVLNVSEAAPRCLVLGSVSRKGQGRRKATQTRRENSAVSASCVRALASAGSVLAREAEAGGGACAVGLGRQFAGEEAAGGGGGGGGDGGEAAESDRAAVGASAAGP